MRLWDGCMLLTMEKPERHTKWSCVTMQTRGTDPRQRRVFRFVHDRTNGSGALTVANCTLLRRLSRYLDITFGTNPSPPLLVSFCLLLMPNLANQPHD